MLEEVIKKIDIKTNPLLIAILSVLIAARVFYNQSCMLLDLAIIGLAVYLAIVFGCWLWSTIQYKRLQKSCKREEKRNLINRQNRTYELIWNYFLGLSDQRLNMLIEIINLPEVDSKYKRVIKPNTMLKEELIVEDYQIAIGLARYLQVLNIGDNLYDEDSPTVVNINPTIYKLVKHYMLTGKKERV